MTPEVLTVVSAKSNQKKMEIPYIGVVKSKFAEPANPGLMREQESEIEIYDEFSEGLFKVGQSDYLEIYFHFHQAKPFELKTFTQTGEFKGVFGTRSPSRPSQLGSTIVKLLHREGNILKVSGLDALDGTPVIDIKPLHIPLKEEEIDENEISRRKNSPRKQIVTAIGEGNTKKLLLAAAQIHGHFCPGLAMGVMMATKAMQTVRQNSDGMEDLLAIVETNNCVSDGIQFVTGCTFGNNALIFKDYGKTAFTLTKRDGKGVRISAKAGSREYMHDAMPLFEESYKKVVGAQNHSDEELARFKKLGIEKAFATLQLDFDRLFKIEEVVVEIPEYAPSHESIICAKCNEPTMETRAVDIGNQKFCLPCAGRRGNCLRGKGIIKVKSQKTNLKL